MQALEGWKPICTAAPSWAVRGGGGGWVQTCLSTLSTCGEWEGLLTLDLPFKMLPCCAGLNLDPCYHQKVGDIYIRTMVDYGGKGKANLNLGSGTWCS